MDVPGPPTLACIGFFVKPRTAQEKRAKRRSGSERGSPCESRTMGSRIESSVEGYDKDSGWPNRTTLLWCNDSRDELVD